MEVPVPSQEDERLCICVVGVLTLSPSVGFWNCSKSVVYFVFHFIKTRAIPIRYIIYNYLLLNMLSAWSIQEFIEYSHLKCRLSIPVSHGASETRQMTPSMKGWSGCYIQMGALNPKTPLQTRDDDATKTLCD